MDEKVCVVCGFISSNYFYSVYMVDLKSNRGILEPVLQIDSSFPANMAVVVWGSKLFMFGGENYPYRQNRMWESSTFAYDLSSSISSPRTTTEVLNERCAERLADMKTPKVNIFAVIIKGKILVFSSTLYSVGEEGNFVHFELFDPVTETWSEFPEPPIDFHQTCRLESYCVDGCKLSISTEHGSVYTIDLEKEEFNDELGISSTWIGYDERAPSTFHQRAMMGWSGFGTFPFRYGGCVVIENIFFSPMCAYLAYDFDCPIPLYFLPWGAPKPKNPNRRMISYTGAQCNPTRRYPLMPTRGGASITHLGGRTMCSVKIGFKQLSKTEEMDPHLIVDVFDFHRADEADFNRTVDDKTYYRSDLSFLEMGGRVPNSHHQSVAECLCFSELKTSTYVLLGNRCEGATVIGCFPIRTA